MRVLISYKWLCKSGMTLLYNVVAVTTVLCSYSYEIIDHRYRLTVCSPQPSFVCGFLSNGLEGVFL